MAGGEPPERTFKVIVRPDAGLARKEDAPGRPKEIGNPEAVYAQVVDLFIHYLGWRHRLLVGFFTFVAANCVAFATIKTKDLLLAVQWAIPFCVSAGSLLFWGLEIRNRELYRSCTEAGKKLEELLGVGSNGVFATLLSSQPRPPITHSDLFDLMFFATSSMSAALGLIAAWSADVQISLRIAAFLALLMIYLVASLMWSHVIAGMQKPESQISSGLVFLALAITSVGVSWMAGYPGETVSFLRGHAFNSLESAIIGRADLWGFRMAECLVVTTSLLACGVASFAPQFLLAKSRLVRFYFVSSTVVSALVVLIAGLKQSHVWLGLSVTFLVMVVLIAVLTATSKRWGIDADAKLGVDKFERKLVRLLLGLFVLLVGTSIYFVGWRSIAFYLFPPPGRVQGGIVSVD
ncbi:MAG: hypothetical protein FD180_1482 [Planctomycetota bacterium]|nr:MAG: hypothetical protein FD180_1482 [Planctomycetota bacterium]